MTRIKICGLFREEDITAVNEAQPDYIGFVFAKSRRQVSIDQAARLNRHLSANILAAGVFVNPELEQVVALCRAGIISIVQLHGQETASFVTQVKQASGCPVIKAVRMDANCDLATWQSTDADYLLLDNGPGGTGLAFDWQQIPPLTKPFFLAGGIDAGNLACALAHNPYCIDVSSGVETNGYKDRNKILQIVSMVRAQ
ncbi:MAG: phosphoribosylanthranilate isomerase [Bacillota bacterium]|nr:phosphoribosylanthranilate isomerase [Bacillota bacterium]